MLHFANSLNLVREHKAVFHGRHHIVVAHRWRNEQNYSFPDALCGDYPLIHNSAWLKDAGDCYPLRDSPGRGATAACGRSPRGATRWTSDCRRSLSRDLDAARI
ncbi:DUF2827 family protein [Paraburkholderia sp. BR14264]|uniref:DUF2827 family protein n=1 Tax=Paraburkholderia sp. BR14264 TaxID=3237001 RepID=UPI00397A5F69